MTHLLDSSAWLAHLFGEPGVKEVTLLFDASNVRVSVSALSIPEVYTRLKAMGSEDRWAEVWDVYAQLFATVIPADEPIAHQAIRLRASTPQRLPTIGGLIAATALVRGLILVHRDPHMAAIPMAELRQMQLPDK
jgi:predicted nucleic acid-binding protein